MEHAVLPVDCRDPDHARVRRGVQRLRRRAVVAHRRDDDHALRLRELHHTLEHLVRRTHEAHVHHRHVLAREPAERGHDPVDQATNRRVAAAVNVRRVKIEAGRGAVEIAGLADEQRRDRGAVRAGDHGAVAAERVHAGGGKRGMGGFDAAVDEANAGGACAAHGAGRSCERGACEVRGGRRGACGRTRRPGRGAFEIDVIEVVRALRVEATQLLERTARIQSPRREQVDDASAERFERPVLQHVEAPRPVRPGAPRRSATAPPAPGAAPAGRAGRARARCGAAAGGRAPAVRATYAAAADRWRPPRSARCDRARRPAAAGAAGSPAPAAIRGAVRRSGQAPAGRRPAA